jgi:hypothetical protein
VGSFAIPSESLTYIAEVLLIGSIGYFWPIWKPQVRRKGHDMLGILAESLLLAIRLTPTDARNHALALRRKEDEDWLASRRKGRFDATTH